MKKKKFSKLSRSLLSVVLVISMSPVTAFAQDTSSDVRLLEENDIQNMIESNKAIRVDSDDIDFSDLLDTEVLLSFSDDEVERIELADETDAKEIKLPVEEQQIHIEEQLSFDADQKQEIASARILRDGRNTRAIGNNSPNTAIYLPSSYFGYTLSNLATNDEDWYCFETTQNGKAAIVFSQQASGQYAILLYKLDASGTMLD